MAGRRLMYLAALTAGTVFYLAYQEWLAWFILILLLLLPWFSLAVSLSAMLSFSAEPEAPAEVDMGIPAEVWLVGQCRLPVPPFKGRIRLRNLQTGASRRYRSGGPLPTEHCGGYSVTAERVWVYDYLGLIGIPARKKAGNTAIVRPLTAKMEAPPDLSRYLARSWRPKPGGGYAENHDMRLYRPGDSLNQVHWKLTAKTGKLMLREPLQPNRGLMLLTVNLRGTPEELDRKFGRLLYLGSHLLEQGLAFQVCALTAEGLQTHAVQTELDLKKCVSTLLTHGCVTDGDIRHREFSASWVHHIGGDRDEA